MYKRLNNEMMARVEGVSYDFVHHYGQLFMPAPDCCHMPACIEFFQRIDPGVMIIQTHSGDELDTQYRFVEGKWKAYEPRRN